LKVKVVFNSLTDRASHFLENPNSKFSCSKLIFLKGLTALRCLWQSNNILSISLIPQNRGFFVNAGDELELLGGKIRAFCPSSSSCDTFEFNEQQTVKILRPKSPVYPTVSLQASSTTLSNCSALVLDPTRSFNKGGPQRPWSRIHWTVTGTGGNVVEIEEELNRHYDNYTTTVFTVESDLMRVGSLSITLHLQNFFGNVAFGSVDITIVKEEAPTASVFGSGNRLWNCLQRQPSVYVEMTQGSFIR
jgi:hypothetical protein